MSEKDRTAMEQGGRPGEEKNGMGYAGMPEKDKTAMEQGDRPGEEKNGMGYAGMPEKDKTAMEQGGKPEEEKTAMGYADRSGEEKTVMDQGDRPGEEKTVRGYSNMTGEEKMTMEYSKKQGKQKKWEMGWVAWGLLLSVLATVLYMCCYGLFRGSGAQELPKNPLETQDTADMLIQQAYVLYHDLMQKQSPETVDYLSLYVKPRQDCEWVLDEKAANRYYAEGEVIADGSPVADGGRVYSYLRYLREDYFKLLEKQFSNQIAYNFDYFCKDTETGVFLTNSALGQEILTDEQYFYLVLNFDPYGNCEIGEVKLGQDATLMRKYASFAARTVSLEEDPNYVNFNEEANVALDSYFTLGRPENCQIVYYIPNAVWQLYERGEAQIYINDRYYSIGMDSHHAFRTRWINNVLCSLLTVMVVLAFLVPVNRRMLLWSGGEKESGSGATGKSVSGWLKLPMELLVIGGCSGVAAGMSICLGIVVATLNGSAAKSLADVLGMAPKSSRVQLLVYGANFLVLTLLFFFVWYIGMNLREMREIGIGDYIRRRSLIYRFIQYMRSRVRMLYDALCHFDLTKKSNKLILRVVVINGIVLFLISALWLGGWGFAVIYSILLYLFLRKYVSDLQKKYAVLLQATNEIAQGNLSVQIQENLGVFEPFRPQIYRIQDGFKRAVEEEVKSQRMKAELITNVSHDLKTPLTAIITYINLMKEEGVTEEQRKGYLETLERKSLRLKALIEDLFEVSKANSQNMTLNLMDVDIMNLIKQVAFEMGDKLTEQKLDLRLALSEEKVVLRIDSQRTYRIYENLFGNIAKYAMPGTRVYVNGFCVEDTVVITLKNITAEEISVKAEELTERFVRGDMARNTEGSGLGLAIAKSFIELQGGVLEIEIDGDLFKVTTVWKK